MTKTTLRNGFFRHFLSGFALGAVALVGVQLADPAAAVTPAAVQGSPIEVLR